MLNIHRLAMVREVQKDTDILWVCEICGFHYREKATAEKCEVWCKEHKSCNLEIIKEAVENQTA